MRNNESPHPRASHGRGIGFEDAGVVGGTKYGLAAIIAYNGRGHYSRMFSAEIIGNQT
jgi:hypothetical protein